MTSVVGLASGSLPGPGLPSGSAPGPRIATRPRRFGPGRPTAEPGRRTAPSCPGHGRLGPPSDGGRRSRSPHSGPPVDSTSVATTSGRPGPTPTASAPVTPDTPAGRSAAPGRDNSVSVHHYGTIRCLGQFGGQFGVSSSLLLPLGTIRCQFIIIASLAWDNSVSGQFGVSSSLLLPLHQVGKLDSWEDFQDRQAMTLFTTRSTVDNSVYNSVTIRCQFIIIASLASSR